MSAGQLAIGGCDTVNKRLWRRAGVRTKLALVPTKKPSAWVIVP